MSSAWLKTVRDGMHRENAERYKTQCLKLNEAINVFAGKTVKGKYLLVLLTQNAA